MLHLFASFLMTVTCELPEPSLGLSDVSHVLSSQERRSAAPRSQRPLWVGRARVAGSAQSSSGPALASVLGLSAVANQLSVAAVGAFGQLTQQAPKTFYVDGAVGEDSNPGSQALPWRTIQKAANDATAGSTVEIAAGIYPERVVVNVSGNAIQGPIIFRGASGGGTIIDGSSFNNADFDSWPGLFGLGLVDITDQSYVRLRNLEIRGLSTGSVNYFLMGVQVAKSASGSAPMQHLELVNLDVHDIRYTGSSDSGGAQGIAFYGGHVNVPIQDVLIQACEVHDLRLGQSESMTLNGNIEGFRISGNSVHDNDNIGIVCIGWEGTAGGSLSDDSSDGNAAIYGGHHPNDRARNGVIADNQVFRCSTEKPVKNPTYPTNDFSAGGIYVDGGRDIVIERNVVFESDVGIELASEHGGVDDNGDDRETLRVICRDNVVYYCGQFGIGVGGYNQFRGPAVDCTVINNTVYKCSSLGWGGGQIHLAKSHDNYLANNLLVARGASDVQDYDGFQNTGDDWQYDHGVVLGSSLNATHNFMNVANNNLYYAQGNLFWKWEMGDNQDPIEGASGLAGLDLAGVFGDPLFVNGSLGISNGSEDLRLSGAGSGAVDVGDTSVPGLGYLDADGLLRVAGIAVDIGAYEFASSTP